MTPAHLLPLSGTGSINMVTSFPQEPQNMYAVSISKALLLATFSTFDSSCTKYLQGRLLIYALLCSRILDHPFYILPFTTQPGLEVTGDEEYFICMQEAICFQIGYLLRGLLVTLILDGGPDPKLWHDFQDDPIEDLCMFMTRAQAVSEALRQIDIEITPPWKKNIKQVNLPSAIHQLSELQRARRAFDRIEQKTHADEKEIFLTPEQRAISTTVINSVTLNRPGAYMADSPAGTGQTFTEEVIAARLRGDGRVFLAVASTGIAVLQPPGWLDCSLNV